MIAMRFKTLVIATAFLTGPIGAHADEPEDVGLEVGGMWESFGAYGYASCLRKEMSPISSDAGELSANIKNAQDACKDAARKMFKTTTMNGGRFPKVFIDQADAMRPKVDAVMIPFFRELLPSSKSLTARVEFYGLDEDGNEFAIFQEAETKLPSSYMFMIRNNENIADNSVSSPRSQRVTHE